jgi:PleD family two-component response regulator
MAPNPVRAAARPRVLAILKPDAATQNLERLLAEEGLFVEVRNPSEGLDVWQHGMLAQAVVVDEQLEPADIAEALRRERIPAAIPVFVLARRLPDRDRYLAWLETGAWDIVKIPLEGLALALRLRNILAGRSAQGAARPARRYTLENLARVADEALALARRYDRPLHCIAVHLDRPEDAVQSEDALMGRVADVTQRLTRRSDLIGIGTGTLLVLLPDTHLGGATVFAQRLEETLRERLDRWGCPTRLSTSIITGADRASGAELLDAAVRSLT